jgi:SAM-dependent methyltransferase
MVTTTSNLAVETFQPSSGAFPPSMEAPPPALDMVKLQTFMNKTMEDMSGAIVSFMCTLGDRLGLFKSLAADGPATSAELAARVCISERYAREWLSTLASAAYLEYDPASGRFALPPEHALILAVEGNPMFMGGGYQLLAGLLGPLDQLMRAFRHGGGVRQEDYDENLRDGMERVSAGWFENLLVQQWIPALPDVQAKLEQGADVADVGCGAGRALIRLALAFPNSRCVGYDVFRPAIARATANVEMAGVADRVRFEQRDLADGLPGQYDLITFFDSLHDVRDPGAGLSSVHQALKPGGTCLVLEMNCADRLEQNTGPMATMLYGTSVLYNLPVSLAGGGAGLGTMGLPESKLKELCIGARFSHVHRLPVQNPFHALYEVKP